MEDSMKSVRMILVFVLATGLMASLAFGAEEAKKTEGEEMPMPPMGPPEEMKMCQEVIGDWKFIGEWRMGPQQEWQETEADVTFEYILDGAAVRMDYLSDMMGMKMHGLSIMAFNREADQWQQMWIDNMTGAISLYTGEVTEEKHIFTGTDVMQGMKIHSKTTTFDITENSFKWEMEHSMDGETWFVGMRGTYTRK